VPLPSQTPASASASTHLHTHPFILLLLLLLLPLVARSVLSGNAHAGRKPCDAVSAMSMAGTPAHPPSRCDEGLGCRWSAGAACAAPPLSPLLWPAAEPESTDAAAFPPEWEPESKDPTVLPLVRLRMGWGCSAPVHAVEGMRYSEEAGCHVSHITSGAPVLCYVVNATHLTTEVWPRSANGGAMDGGSSPPQPSSTDTQPLRACTHWPGWKPGVVYLTHVTHEQAMAWTPPATTDAAAAASTQATQGRADASAAQGVAERPLDSAARCSVTCCVDCTGRAAGPTGVPLNVQPWQLAREVLCTRLVSASLLMFCEQSRRSLPPFPSFSPPSQPLCLYSRPSSCLTHS